VNSIAAIAGSFIGLVLGGVLAPVAWRLVFLVSVPIGVIATFWAYRSLRELGERRAAQIDWWGNATFALGLVGVMIGITYGIQPYGGHTMGWTSPFVLANLFGGIAFLVLFCLIELRVEEPMFHLELFRIRAFAAGNLAALLAAMGRGGLQFILIIWLQGIWLPEHGYNFAQTPFWAGIYMLPLIAGFLIAGPASGYLSDRFGARPFATGGMVLAALSFLLLILLPVNFSYTWFALILVLNGVGMGLFSSPNSAGVMNSLPSSQRGAGAGMLATFINTASVLSIGVFFTLMIVGLSAGLPHTLQTGLIAHGVPAVDAGRISHLPPVATLFSSFLGYNPMATLLGPHVLAGLPPTQAHVLTGRGFFPHLISGSFHTALIYAFVFAIAACLVAAVASLLRGGKYHYVEAISPAGSPTGIEPVEPDVPETARIRSRRTAEETA
jgi:MFS family permease